MNGAAKNPGALIGRGLDRVDGRLKVMGGARYAADALVANAAHAVAVGSRTKALTITSNQNWPRFAARPRRRVSSLPAVIDARIHIQEIY